MADSLPMRLAGALLGPEEDSGQPLDELARALSAALRLERKRLSDKEMAAMLGVTTKTLSRWIAADPGVLQFAIIGPGEGRRIWAEPWEVRMRWRGDRIVGPQRKKEQ